MSDEFHKHVLDGKEVYYKTGDCPICGTRKAITGQKEDRDADVHVKNETIVVQSGKALMMTIHAMKDKPVVLFNMKWMAKNADGSLIIGNDKHPMWNQKTIGMTKTKAKAYYDFLGQLLNNTLPKDTTAPTRA